MFKYFYCVLHFFFTPTSSERCKCADRNTDKVQWLNQSLKPKRSHIYKLVSAGLMPWFWLGWHCAARGVCGKCPETMALAWVLMSLLGSSSLTGPKHSFVWMKKDYGCKAAALQVWQPVSVGHNLCSIKRGWPTAETSGVMVVITLPGVLWGKHGRKWLFIGLSSFEGEMARKKKKNLLWLYGEFFLVTGCWMALRFNTVHGITVLLGGPSVFTTGCLLNEAKQRKNKPHICLRSLEPTWLSLACA